MDKKKTFLSKNIAVLRGWIQAAATLLTNIHIPNLWKGKIYQGSVKNVCVPGLNCYSCPAATGACPIGAFQAVVGSSGFKFSYYITGFFILLGVTLGRFICGFLCPFGWFQDLLHKIPGKKFSTARLRPLRYLKYIILIIFVILLPMLVTNSMMTEMSEKGADFDEVLKDAQAKGYAEKDPTADIEGYDACRKIAILTSLVCGQQVDFEDIHTEGITHISATDIKYAKAMGRAIKLLATSKKTDGGYVAMVAPFLLPKEHPLYNVNGVFNAIFVHGNVLGDAMFYGSGAGKLPTASAVVADVVEMAKNVDKNIPVEWSSKKLELVDYRSAENRFFVRVSGTDKASVEKVFGNVEYIDAQGVTGELGFVTEVMTEEALENKKAAYGEVLNVIRVA